MLKLHLKLVASTICSTSAWVLSDYESYLKARNGGNNAIQQRLATNFASLELSDVNATDQDRNTRRDVSARQAGHVNSERLVDTVQV